SKLFPQKLDGRHNRRKPFRYGMERDTVRYRKSIVQRSTVFRRNPFYARHTFLSARKDFSYFLNFLYLLYIGSGRKTVLRPVLFNMMNPLW
ncbi:hypothetical protein LCGC14_2177320, partial [marine sediment metagenome]